MMNEKQLKMQAIISILDIAPRTYYLWKKEHRPIITFLELYFTSSELSEFFETGRMKRLETENIEATESFKLFQDFLEWKKQTNR